MEQVQEGPQMIQQNLENLQELFTVLTTTLSRLPQVSQRYEDRTPVLSPSQDNLL
jgi:hypothetical protein